tara:strand:- start:440 stop:616 length:177 start_codon:yes stop_codon:yes gene_type:complete
MNITSAKYFTNPMTKDVDSISVNIDGVEWLVPIDNASARYREVQRQVEAGTLTIADAD